MKRKLRAKLLNGSIGIITGVLILAFLLDYTNTGTLPSLSTQSVTNIHPEYFLTTTYNVEFDRGGQVEIKLTSDEIRHNPADDSAQLKSPRVELFDKGQREWTVNSQLGKISADGSTIDLEQRVEVASEDQLTLLKTPQLLIFPNEKMAKTDKPVTLQNPYGFTRSIGLTADMESKRVELLQQVRGQYQGVALDDEQ